jgi:hypothetical protein
MKERLRVASILAVALSFGCGGNSSGGSGPSSDSATASIGTAGGVIRTPGGAAVEVPFGALDKTTQLTFSTTSIARPDGVAANAPIYRLEPAGLVFARPVKVTLPLPPGASGGALYLARSGATTFSPFDSVGGSVSGGSVSAETPYFGLGVIGPATPTRTVIGVGQITWASGTTRDSEAMDFASQGVEALVRDAGGNLARIPGIAGAAPGTFLVSGVPDGEYTLHSGKQYFVTSTSSPDLGTQLGGRPARLRTPITTAAQINLTLSGLAPWQLTDQLEFYGTEEDDWDFFTDRFAALNAGDTSASFFLDLSQFDGTSSASAIHAQGDHSFLAQIEHRATPSGVPYDALARIARLPAFDVQSGSAPVPVSATMADAVAAPPLSIDYRGSQWDGALTAGNPAQVPLCPDVGCRGFLGVLGQAGSALDGFYAANADLVVVEDPAGDGIIGPLSYGVPPSDPASGTWDLLFDVRRFATVFPTLLAGTTIYGPNLALGLSAGLDWTTSRDVAATTPIAPPITLPVGATVAGKPFFTDAAGVGVTPAIAWSAPRTGQPASYTLRIIQLSVIGGNQTGATTVATVVTPHPSFTIPDGILQAGSTYVFFLGATAATSPAAASQLASAPFRPGLDIATAGMISGSFTP